MLLIAYKHKKDKLGKMKKLIKKYFNKLPYLSRLIEYETHYPPGHFYSPIPNHQGISLANKSRHLPIKDVELNDASQLDFFESLAEYIETNPFTNELEKEGSIFYNKNGFYGYGDAQILQAFIRKVQPNRVIEIGSGFSSALLQETNEAFFDNRIDIKLIEPYPGRLRKTFKGKSKVIDTILIEKKLEEVDISLFRDLKSGDILFIDSSHVLKAGSDLYVLFFEILPLLEKGVYIHFHDIFYGFEYLDSHYKGKKGFGWNENYFLRAFLMNNKSYKVVLFLNHIDTLYAKQLKEYSPSYRLNAGGACWIRKVAE